MNKTNLSSTNGRGGGYLDILLKPQFSVRGLLRETVAVNCSDVGGETTKS